MTELAAGYRGTSRWAASASARPRETATPSPRASSAAAPCARRATAVGQGSTAATDADGPTGRLAAPLTAGLERGTSSSRRSASARSRSPKSASSAARADRSTGTTTTTHSRSTSRGSAASATSSGTRAACPRFACRSSRSEREAIAEDLPAAAHSPRVRDHRAPRARHDAEDDRVRVRDLDQHGRQPRGERVQEARRPRSRGAVFAHRSKSPSSTCSSPSGARRSRNEALGASTPDGSGHHILAGHPKGTGILVGRLQDSEGLFHECLPAAARFEHGLAGERYRVVPALDLQVLPS